MLRQFMIAPVTTRVEEEEFDQIFLCRFIADLLIAEVVVLIKDNGSKG